MNKTTKPSSEEILSKVVTQLKKLNKNDYSREDIKIFIEAAALIPRMTDTEPEMLLSSAVWCIITGLDPIKDKVSPGCKGAIPIYSLLRAILLIHAQSHLNYEIETRDDVLFIDNKDADDLLVLLEKS